MQAMGDGAMKAALGPLLHVKWMTRGHWGAIHVCRVPKVSHFTPCGQRLAGVVAVVPGEPVTCQHCLKHIGAA